MRCFVACVQMGAWLTCESEPAWRLNAGCECDVRAFKRRMNFCRVTLESLLREARVAGH